MEIKGESVVIINDDDGDEFTFTASVSKSGTAQHLTVVPKRWRIVRLHGDTRTTRPAVGLSPIRGEYGDLLLDIFGGEGSGWVRRCGKTTFLMRESVPKAVDWCEQKGHRHSWYR